MDALDRPVPTAAPGEQRWGSDILAEALRDVGIAYLAINPGASLRGLHDSLVNYLGNRDPQVLLCLHEEHAAAIAHGYAKVADRPMGVAVHSNVGLLHASMAIFNAYCDRVPMLVVGATGPIDASLRRPWIDWIHTCADQGGLVRPFLKWDDQPASLAAAMESIARAVSLATTRPCAPAYICFDVSLQERALAATEEAPALRPLARPRLPAPVPEAVREIASLLLSAESPVLLTGRVSRDRDDWDRRVELAERVGCAVITDRKTPAAFPAGHPLHRHPAGIRPSAGALREIRDADVVLSLDWVDLAGTLRLAEVASAVSPRVVSVSLDSYLHNGWTKDHQAVAAASLTILADTDVSVRLLLDEVRRRQASAPDVPVSAERPDRSLSIAVEDSGPVTMHDLAGVLRAALAPAPTTIVRVPIGWPPGFLDIEDPLDFLGADGGAGVGSGPGLAVGAALALRDSSRVAVAVIGDGDYLMGAGALWTAVHHHLPLLVVVANNRSYFSDELHQERVARDRGRPPENRWIGQRIDNPAVDIGGSAAAYGAQAIGPVECRGKLRPRLGEALAAAVAGDVVVVDVVVTAGHAAGVAETAG